MPRRLERLDLRDVPLGEACRLLSEETGVNIVPSAGASREKISLYVENIALVNAVELMCRAHGLWFHQDPSTGIVEIRTADEYRSNIATLRDEETEYFTLLYPNALDVGLAIRNLLGDRVDLRFGTADDEVLRDLEDRLQRFDLFDERTQGLSNSFGGVGTNSRNRSGLSYGAGSTLGRNRLGRSSSSYGGRNGRGSTIAGREGLDEEERAPLDLTPEQIQALERGEGWPSEPARESTLERIVEQRDTGIHVTVVPRHNKIIVRTRDTQALGDIRTLIQRLDVPTPLVLLELRVLSVELGDGFTSFFEYQWADSDGELAGAFTSGSIVNPVPPSLDLGGSGVNAGALVFQFMNDHFAARMQLLEERGRVHVVSTPLLLTANNEVGRLFVGREVPLNRSFLGSQIVTNQTTTVTAPGTTDIEFRPVGTTLLITPNINSDRTVTLRIVQETSNVDSTETVLVPTSNGFVPQDVNVVSSQSVSGTIVAKSELAVAFGGLIESRTSKERAQVPFLGDLPLIGALFRRVVDRETRREIVVVVRPHVL
ncbi:MAG: hypothetical protein KDC38_10150, partial [Planctomycetes bacterium]|nr:hypothetical protein [Planctomycetota bacterium]